MPKSERLFTLLQIPDNLSQQLESSALFIDAGSNPPPFLDDVFIKLRHALRQQLKVKLTYRNQQQQCSQRIIYPFAIGFFEQTQLAAAWCELRQTFRYFRPDQIIAIELCDEHYQPDRTLLFAALVSRKRGLSAPLNTADRNRHDLRL
ncbi:helix-turn-helix transcriptional regulator [Chelonobacter oris]|uniref:helix-turn-helix transcriptional regulator n=1 Tax=Chelonobacter oris TaxID=505317 RepID=UPI000689B908|nr:WYL domain-containing protein [Chelonobacter oris]